MVLFLLLSFHSKASHAVGAEITYKCLGNNKYEVTLKAYRDCNGIQMDSAVLKASCNGMSFFDTLHLISKADATGINPKCNIFSRCSGTYKHGIEEYTFRKVIDLSGLNCCEVSLSWFQVGRTSSITTGAANQGFYTEAIVNKCVTPCNSSPGFASSPIIFAARNEDLEFYNKAVDTIDTTDSLSFKLVAPLIAQGAKANYIGNWSENKPLTFLGFPKTTYNYPSGFYFDSETGDMKFVPAIVNEVTTFGIEVTEWRTINGIATKIGVLRREILITVTEKNTTEQANFRDVLGELVVCKLTGTVCRDIPLKRKSGYNDTIDLNYTHSLQNITFTNVGSSSNPVIRVCYTPTIAEINSNTPPSFTIQATTNSCPFQSIVKRTFKWVERPPLPDSFELSSKLQCRRINLLASNKSQLVKEANYSYTVRHNGIFINTNTLKNIKDTGWYYFKLLVQSSNFCAYREYYDSLYVPQSVFVTAGLPNDTAICFNRNYKVKIYANKKNLKFIWNGDITDSLSTYSGYISGQKDKIRIEVTDDNGCYQNDSINIRFYNPSFTLTGDTIACAGDEVQVKANLKDTIKPTFGWFGFATGRADIKFKPTQSNQLAFYLIDSSGCSALQTHYIQVYSPEINYKHNHVYCESDSIILIADVSGGLAPYQLLWKPFNTTNDTVILGNRPRGDIQISTIVKDNFGCIDTQHQNIRVNPTPDFQFTGLPILCESSTEILLTNYIRPQKGIWSGEGVSSNYFRPYSVTPGKKKLTYFYMDSIFFCSNEISAEIEVDAHPVADFVADSVVGEYTRTFNFTNTSRYGNKHTFIWNFGDPNSGNTNKETTLNSKHIFSDTGTFTIKLKVSGGTCPDDSITKVGYIKAYKNSKPDSTTTSIKTFNNNSFIVYPNPAHNELIIESKSRIGKVIIYNTLGQIVTQKGNIAENSIKLNVENLSKGLYILSIEGVKSIPFIKK